MMHPSIHPVSDRASPIDLALLGRTQPAQPAHHMARSRPILAHSPMRWGPGSDRPRQLFSRLANHHPVLYLEAPMYAAIDAPTLQVSEPHRNVLRAVPLLPVELGRREDVSRASVAALLDRTLLPAHADGREPAWRLAHRFSGAIQWFCSPMDAPAFIGRFGTVGVVYDRTAALATPQRLAPDFIERDRSLVQQARLVLLGDEAAAPVSRRIKCTGALESQQSLARRAAWDGIAASIRARLSEAFQPTRHRSALSPGFIAASLIALGLDQTSAA